MSGRNDGKQAVLGALGQIGQDFESFSVTPDEMVDGGDTIVVLSHIEGRAKGGGEVKLPGIEVWRMREGIAQRVQSLIDTAEVKEARGR